MHLLELEGGREGGRRGGVGGIRQWRAHGRTASVQRTRTGQLQLQTPARAVHTHMPAPAYITRPLHSHGDLPRVLAGIAATYFVSIKVYTRPLCIQYSRLKSQKAFCKNSRRSMQIKPAEKPVYTHTGLILGWGQIEIVYLMLHCMIEKVK